MNIKLAESQICSTHKRKAGTPYCTSMEPKELNAMMALSKFLVLLALFLSASHAHAFTRLCLVAGYQVRINHLILLQQPMSDPKNELSSKSIHKPTTRMNLNAELPNNLSPKKTQVAYSEPKQDAELSSKITDLTNTQTCGLCHNKASEQVTF